MITPTTALVIAVILSIISVAFVLGMQLQKLISRLAAMQERLAKLEEARRTRNPWPTNDGLEDAMAIVHDAAWQARETLDYVDCRMHQVDRVLQTIRSDPDSYNADAPNHKKTR